MFFAKIKLSDTSANFGGQVGGQVFVGINSLVTDVERFKSDKKN
jgi:hypothetical protein